MNEGLCTLLNGYFVTNKIRMPYFMITVKETRAGAKRRRKLVVASDSKTRALIVIQDMCRETGFAPDYSTLHEITNARYSKMVGTLLGRDVTVPAS